MKSHVQKQAAMPMQFTLRKNQQWGGNCMGTQASASPEKLCKIQLNSSFFMDTQSYLRYSKTKAKHFPPQILGYFSHSRLAIKSGSGSSGSDSMQAEVL